MDHLTPEDVFKKRCKEAGLTFEETNRSSGDTPRKYYRFYLPNGREKRLVFFTEAQLADLLEVAFEKYVFLADYEAICSYEDGVIEALIRSLNYFGVKALQEIFTGETRVRKPSGQSWTFKVEKDSDETATVSIGTVSKELAVLGGGEVRFSSSYSNYLFVRITGLNVKQHDDAVKHLEHITNSFFFQIDLLYNVPLSLVKTRRAPTRRARRGQRDDLSKLEFPSFQYDSGAMALYWYARSARGMPLLQYLAYYQSVEFYFPTYSQMEAHRRIRNLLKDPTFNPHRDTDIARILSIASSQSSRGYGDERSQLRATVNACVTSEEIHQFLTRDSYRQDFFSAKQRTIDAQKLPLANPSADLRNDVADRIYDIRCMIVHTKSTTGKEEVDLLLPFSKEAEALSFDIELIEYVAQRVLIASSNPLRLI